MRVLATLLCWLLLVAQAVAVPSDHASKIASLIDPAKLSRLGKRGANTREQKAVYWLEMARKEGETPAKVLVNVRQTGVKGRVKIASRGVPGSPYAMDKPRLLWWD
jgi:hypothetical protein